MEKRTILLIPNTHIGWYAVRRTLDSLPECKIIGETTDAASARSLTDQYRPTAIIASPFLDHGVVLPLLASLHAEISPWSKILLIANDCPPQFHGAGLERWLSGYLLWHQLTPETLFHCLVAILDGDIFLGNRTAIFAIAGALHDAAIDPELAAQMSERDRAVLRQLAKGQPIREIARRLELSERTVRRSIEHMEAALTAPDRFVLAVKAMRAGLLAR